MSNDDRSLNEKHKHQETCKNSQRLLLPSCGPNHSPYYRITHVDVFLGSLTFTSEQLAFSLAEKAKLRGAVVTVQSLDEFHAEKYIDSSSSYRVAVFVVSTHAAGKPAPNAEKFLLWLRKTSTPFCSPTYGPPPVRQRNTIKSLMAGASSNKTSNTTDQSPRTRQINMKGIGEAARQNFYFKRRSSCDEGNPPKASTWFQYAVFGIGNSIHRTFNATAKYINSRLEELGAVSICPLGLGDISKNVDTTFESWETHFLQMVDKPADPLSTTAALEETSLLLPVHRASLPCATTTTKAIDKILQDTEVSRGPTLADLELLLVTKSRGQSRQRRHSSATTMILPRRTRFDLKTAISPTLPNS